MTDKTAFISPPARPAPPVRCRMAVPADVEAIFDLIDEASRTTTVLPRPREVIRERIATFIVAERDGRILGCGALGFFTPHLVEIRSLVVADGLRGQGIGAAVVRGLVEAARHGGVKRVFALTDSPVFFERLGFAQTHKDSLPHKVWNECVHCPKFLTCTEVAVDLYLSPEAVLDPSLKTLEGPPGGPAATS